MRLFKPQQKKSVRQAISSGEWLKPSISWTVVIAVLGVIGDILTTSWAYLAGYQELNPEMAQLELVDPQLALTYFFFISFITILLITLNLSWFSEAAAIYTIATNGFATINNFLVFVVGFSMLGTFGYSNYMYFANSISVGAVLYLLYKWESDIHEILVVTVMALVLALLQLWTFV